MHRYTRKALKLAFLVQLLVDEILAGLEFAFVLLLLPLSWSVHPVELVLSAARHVQRSATIFDLLLVSSTINEIWVYITWLLARYERMNFEVNRLEHVIKRKVLVMRSIQNDYQRGTSAMLQSLSVPKGTFKVPAKGKVVKLKKLRPVRVGQFTRRNGIKVPSTQLEKPSW